MREPVVMALLGRRLAELGCPGGKLRLSVRELREHYEDLKQAALAEGLSESDAETRAEKLLGEPYALAAQIAAVLRQSSWWGRHPIIGFCLLPLLGMVLMMALGVSADALVCQLVLKTDDLAVMADYPAALALLSFMVLATWCGMLALTAMFFCRLALRAGRGLGWVLVACAACSFYTCCVGIRVQPHQVSMNCGLPPALFHPEWIPLNWIPPFIPLLVAVRVWWRRRQMLKLFPVPEGAMAGIRAPFRRPALSWRGWLTPSGVIATVIVGGITFFALRERAIILKRIAEERSRAATVWPAERAAVEQQLKSGQITSVVPAARTVSLKPWINAALADSLGAPDDAGSNNLAALPTGVRVFAGVPFDVEGRVQLMGRKLLESTTMLESTTRFPVRARNLRIDGKFNRLHVLQGASGITEDMGGKKVAELILHYADGSQARLPIVAGEQVRDWWGPVYETAAGWNARNPTAATSVLAWTGSNPRIKEDEPEESLRLYKSTFGNPHPEQEVSSIDFVSTVTDAAPFILGLTVE